jgi:hypothetical protein
MFSQRAAEPPTTRIGRHLERCGQLVRDAEASHLSREPGEDADLDALQNHSISCRIAAVPPAKFLQRLRRLK